MHVHKLLWPASMLVLFRLPSLPPRQRMFTETRVPPLPHLLCLLLFRQRLANGQQRSESSLWGMGTQNNGPTVSCCANLVPASTQQQPDASPDARLLSQRAARHSLQWRMPA